MDSASLIKGKDNNNIKKLQKFDVNKLNSLFDSSNSETTNHIHLIDPVNNYNFYEQYLEIQSTKLLIFDENACKNFFIISLNIRSLSNSLNFSKLEAFVHNLNSKPLLLSLKLRFIIIYLDHIAILMIMFLYQIVEKLLKVVELVSMSNVAINLLLLMK